MHAPEPEVATHAVTWSNTRVQVHVIGHIPSGSGDCLKTWSWQYYKIVNRLAGACLCVRVCVHYVCDSVHIWALCNCASH